MQKRRVLLGMSGGTDSSVAAMLLQDEGFEVTGVTFRFFDSDSSDKHLEDAKTLASQLAIRHIVYDARDVFRDQIIHYFIDEYMSGRTPVPCVLCNNHLKWPLLARIADENDIYYISTGHYVRKEDINGTYYIRGGADEDKDQSFFLWGLKQDILKRILLPMGEITKKEARAIALAKGFAPVSVKKDSIGVCFCPLDYHTFLRKHVDQHLFKRGAFIDEDDKFIAWHQGYPFYTVGQRRGLGIHLNRAVFVKEIRPEINQVVLAPLASLEKQEMHLKDWNIINEELLFSCEDLIVKIRYRKQANRCRVEITPAGLLHVMLYEPLTAIAPGQAAAFYKGDIVLGGGIIV